MMQGQVRMAASLHPFEPHTLSVRHPGRDVAAGEAGLALRHLFLRAAQCLPPRGALRGARQAGLDDRLDLLETQDEFGARLLFQIIAQREIGPGLDEPGLDLLQPSPPSRVRLSPDPGNQTLTY